MKYQFVNDLQDDYKCEFHVGNCAHRLFVAAYSDSKL